MGLAPRVLLEHGFRPWTLVDLYQLGDSGQANIIASVSDQGDALIGRRHQILVGLLQLEGGRQVWFGTHFVFRAEFIFKGGAAGHQIDAVAARGSEWHPGVHPAVGQGGEWDDGIVQPLFEAQLTPRHRLTGGDGHIHLGPFQARKIPTVLPQ